MDAEHNNKDYKLVKIYCYVCEKFEDCLQFQCERFSNNLQPMLTDQEIVTIYLFAMYHQGIFKLKQIHRFVKDYLLDWFPDLGNCQAFSNRINRIANVMGALAHHSVLDSMPIITCSGKRKAKVAREIADKGYCSTKGMNDYGLKLHTLGSLPHPEQIHIRTSSSVNDFALYKEAWCEMEGRIFPARPSRSFRFVS